MRSILLGAPGEEEEEEEVVLRDSLTRSWWLPGKRMKLSSSSSS